LLRRSQAVTGEREFGPAKFEPLESLHGQAVLLIDDTWTTGASAQSAAAALRQAGSGPVAAVVIGRHLNRDWHENDSRLREAMQRFDWDTCAVGSH
jgi:orotate phosphoribosyltransferase